MENIFKTLTTDDVSGLQLNAIIDFLEKKEIDDKQNYVFSKINVTNEKYGMTGFSEEIEKSEKDRTNDEMEHYLKNKENVKFNSDKWKKNHLKISKTVDCPGPVLTAENGTFKNQKNIKVVSDWYNVLNANGLKIYSFTF